MELLGRLIALVFIGASEIVGRIGVGIFKGLAAYEGRRRK